ncbi:hypothetical protein GOP47_0015663 [Adiantum capillus-veneris]|uniref:CD2 antigen cytoplasmic tail-binding protein 2 n=1 Tax=Adiantum capillus-veneris TaxID=13818 RepID=A0A9D4UKF1_ADICA|nr:hypothetical protein GOP47_0015663 [Adiantum capillus-veneris]
MAQRKRGRFSYDEPEPDDEHREKKVRFPKGKKESQRSGRNLSVIFEGEEDDNPIKSTDPRVAATERAVKRSVTLDHHDDTSIPTDVYEAEEDFEDSDEEEKDEISLEPFNLKQEREAGYFDEHGNYVEYINENIKDAWLDSVQVDTTIAAKHLKRYAEEEVEHTLLSKDLAAIKRRIADALQPGETVLKALRRLKSTSTEKDKHLREKMPAHTKELFDTLTEDAMKLLDHGEYNVYYEEKETFEREAEGYESLERAKRGVEVRAAFSEPSNGTATENPLPEDTSTVRDNQGSGSSTQASMDMFAEDDNQNAAGNNNSNQGEGHATNDANDSGYVFDETSGYVC